MVKNRQDVEKDMWDKYVGSQTPREFMENSLTKHSVVVTVNDYLDGFRLYPLLDGKTFIRDALRDYILRSINKEG